MIRLASVLIAGLLLLGPVVGLELGVRALIDQGRLPLAPSSSDETDISLANLLRQGKADVLALGSSSTRSGVKPTTLERRIYETTGETVRVQNAAQAGMSLRAQRLLVRGLADRGVLPEVVITGLTPVTLTGIFGAGDDWFGQSGLGQLISGCTDLSFGLDWLDCQLARGSATWRWRGQTDELAEAVAEGMPTSAGNELRWLHENGWLETISAQRLQLERRIERALDGIPEDLTAPQQVVDDFAALVDELRSHGVTVIAFELPYLAALEEALEERRPGWTEEVAAGYARLGAAADIEIVDIEDYGGWARHQSFRDPRHLSGQGAGPFTRQLWNSDGFREPLLEALGLTLIEEPAATDSAA